MHIIFGNEQATAMAEKYTVLELDTFRVGNNSNTVTAYCAVENIPFSELEHLIDMKTLHEHMLINYRLRNWKDCQQAIIQLAGKWGGELDSFYKELTTRVDRYLIEEPAPDWTPVIQK